MKKYSLLLFVVFNAAIALAQNQTQQKVCSTAESRQFDFWIGTWELTWNDTSKGTNTITKMMDGCALHEDFYDPASQFKGESWSVYNPVSKLWQQTWVDNQGGYITLTGKFENGTMTLTTQPKVLPGGNESTSRMVFSNIAPGSFDWQWEASTDKGKSWKTNWLIHYKRKL